MTSARGAKVLTTSEAADELVRLVFRRKYNVLVLVLVVLATCLAQCLASDHCTDYRGKTLEYCSELDLARTFNLEVMPNMEDSSYREVRYALTRYGLTGRRWHVGHACPDPGKDSFEDWADFGHNLFAQGASDNVRLQHCLVSCSEARFYGALHVKCATTAQECVDCDDKFGRDTEFEDGLLSEVEVESEMSDVAVKGTSRSSKWRACRERSLSTVSDDWYVYFDDDFEEDYHQDEAWYPNSDEYYDEHA